MRGLSLLLAMGFTGVGSTVVRAQIMDDQIFSLVQFDQLEYRRNGVANPVGWDMYAWVGGDFTRVWLKSEGDLATVGNEGDVEVQLLYSRLFSAFWEWQVGGRVDVQYGGGRTETRVLAVLGLEGLAPYWFEVEPAVFVSHKGDVSARLTTTYDMFITQRAIAQPRVEVNAAVQSVAEFGIGSGLNDVALGLRLRYEFRREYAPYIGVNWTQLLAGTADLARQAGASTGEVALVAGVRMWF